MKKKISPEVQKHLEDLYQKLLKDENVLNMKKVPMHRGSNCYLHSFRVAKLAVHKAVQRKNIRLDAILMASVLHDYYLYDWRKDKSKKRHHGSRHPYIAAEQAKRDFDIDELTQSIIKSHMWPLNFSEFPRSREALYLSIADKMIATREALCSKKHKEKRMEKYYKNIEKLFD